MALTEDQLKIGHEYQFVGKANSQPVSVIEKITDIEVHTRTARWWKPEFLEKFVVYVPPKKGEGGEDA